MRLADSAPLSPLARERTLKLRLILVATLTIGVWILVELVVEPRIVRGSGLLRGWTAGQLVHFFEGAMIGALVIVGPLWLLVRRNGQLRQAQRELTQTAEGARSAFYNWDMATNRVKGWGSLRRVFGMATDAAEFAPDEWLHIVHPMDVEPYKAAFAAHLKGETDQIEIDYRIRDKDGAYLWLRDRASAVRDSDGRVQAVAGTIQNVTELKAAERALRDSEERFALATEATRSGIWDWDLDTGRIVISKRCAEILNQEFGDQVPAPDWWEECVEPEDAERYKALLRAHLKGETDHFECEYRLETRTGDRRWLRDRAVAVRDGYGRARRVVGAVDDITQRKRADADLRAAHMRINDFATAGTDWFWETDRNHKVTFVTDRYTEISGVTAATALGKSRRELAGEDQVRRDPKKWADHVETLDRHAPFRDFEYAITNAEGEEYTVSISGVPVFDDKGAFVGYRGTGSDITAQRRAQRELAQRESQLRAIFENAPVCLSLKGLDGRIIQINRQAADTLGLAPEDLVGRRIEEVTPGDRSARTIAHEREALESGRAVTRDTSIDAPDGPRDFQHIRFPVRDEHGAVIGLGFVGIDVTENKRIEHALRESEARNRLALSANNSSIWEWIFETGEVVRTPRCAEIMGLESDELSSEPSWWLDNIHPEDVARYKAAFKALLKGETERFECEYRVRSRDSGHRWLRDRAVAQRNAAGRAVSVTGSVEDITDEKSIGEALRKSEATLHSFLENAPLDIAVQDVEGRYVLLNRTGCERFGIEEAEAIGRRPADIMPAALAERIAADDREALETGAPTYQEMTHLMPDGRQVEMLHLRFPIIGDDGACFGIGAVAQDVTEARAAERKIKSQREQLRAMADALPAMIVYIDRDRRIGFINRAAEQWWGRSREEVLGRPIREVPGEEHYRRFAPYLAKVFAGEEVHLSVGMACADGKTRQLDRRYVPHRDEAGNVVGVYGMSLDVTERKANEEKLRHSQKMEAVGQLTGGIAHDFNNLMLAVQGNLEFLEEDLGADADAQALRFVRNARKGVSRATELTARLLAFSRRQTLHPEDVDVVALLDEFRELVRRTLPENVELVTEVDVDPRRISIDAGQLENALLNLAINARDAMPDGGTVTVRIGAVAVEAADLPPSSDAAPGAYVRIDVVDTGAGMPPEVIDRAFEPFFTTKGVGQGTGLGLSMVHGFVEQSGGFVTIDSAPGAGTTISLYLPADRGAGLTATHIAAAIDVPQARGLVLLAEDDEMVREVAALYLANLGFDVLLAAGGDEAAALLDAGRHIDLLLTDVAMPGGLNGVALAERACEQHPGLRVVLMTGYADETVRLPDCASGDIPILRKPFTQEALARTVAAALDAAPPLLRQPPIAASA